MFLSHRSSFSKNFTVIHKRSVLRYVFVLLSALSNLVACQSTQKNYQEIYTKFEAKSHNLTIPKLKSSKAHKEVSELSSAFYKDQHDLQALQQQAEELQQQYPSNFEIHEILAQIAELNIDHRKAWQHWMIALADLRNDQAQNHLKSLKLLVRDQNQKNAELALMKNLQQRHPDPVMRHKAELHRIHLENKFIAPNQIEYLNSDIALANFSILGPFDNDQGKGFYKNHFDPTKFIEKRPFQGKAGIIEWRNDIQTENDGRFIFSKYLSPANGSLAYLHTYLWSEVHQDVQLRLSTAQDTQVWVNGENVLNIEKLKKFSNDNIVQNIHISKGYNQILIKSGHRYKVWNLRVRLTDLKGSPLQNIRSTAQQPNSLLSFGQATIKLSNHSNNKNINIKDTRSQFWHLFKLYNYGFNEEATNQLQQFVTKHPNNMLAQKLYIKGLFTREEKGKAVEIRNKLITSNPLSAPYFLLSRARYHTAKGRLQLANKDLKKLHPKNKTKLPYIIALNKYFNQRSWPSKACLHLKDALQKYDSYQILHQEYMYCLTDQGFKDAAYSQLKLLHDLEPGNISTRLSLMRTWDQMRQFDKIIAQQEILKRKTQNSHYLNIRFAEFARNRGDIDAAIAYAKKAKTIKPGASYAYDFLGNLYYALKRDQEALKEWQQSLERAPNNPELHALIKSLKGEEDDFLMALVPSDDRIQKVIKNANSVEIFPGTDVLNLLDDEVTMINQDGSYRSIVTWIKYAVNKKGSDALIRNNYPGNSHLLQSYALSKSGERQEATSIRQNTIRFRKMEQGSLIVIQYELDAHPRGFLPNHYVGNWYFQSFMQQSEAARWVLILDKNKDFHFSIQNTSIKHQASVLDDKYQKHVFSAQHMPPFLPEIGMPPANNTIAKVSVSTVRDWQEYVHWERAILKEAFRSSPELTALVKKLTSKDTSKKQKIDHIFHYVAQSIRYQQDYESSIAGVKPHACSIVLKRGYGDCKDKAVLMIQLAKELGIKINFAILRTRPAGKVNKEIPNQQFNHAIVYIPAQKGIEKGFFMDPTIDGVDLGSMRADDQGAISLVLDPETGEHQFLQIPYQESSFETSSISINTTILNAEQATSTVHFVIKGNSASAFRRLFRNKEQLSKQMQAITAHFFSGGKLKNIIEPKDAEDILHPLEFTLEINSSKSLRQEQLGIRFALPAFQNPYGRLLALSERNLNIDLGILKEMKFHHKLTLPLNSSVKQAPANFKLKHPCFNASRVHKKSKIRAAKKSTITIDYNFKQNCTEVKAHDYNEFKAKAEKLKLYQQDHLILNLTKTLNL